MNCNEDMNGNGKSTTGSSSLNPSGLWYSSGSSGWSGSESSNSDSIGNNDPEDEVKWVY